MPITEPSLRPTLTPTLNQVESDNIRTHQTASLTMEPTLPPTIKPSSAPDSTSTLRIYSNQPTQQSPIQIAFNLFMNNPQSYKSIILSTWTLAHMYFERYEIVVAAYFPKVKARQSNDIETSLRAAILNRSVFKTITIIQCHYGTITIIQWPYRDNIETITVIQCQYRTITIIQWPCMDNFKTFTIILRHYRTITTSNDRIKTISSFQSRW